MHTLQVGAGIGGLLRRTNLLSVEMNKVRTHTLGPSNPHLRTNPHTNCQTCEKTGVQAFQPWKQPTFSSGGDGLNAHNVIKP